MELYRLARMAYAQELSGIGAARYGARWNSKGVELIYAATNRSLAMAEVAVHLSLASLPLDYQMLTIFVPDRVSFATLALHELPADWNAFPHPLSTQKFGDAFVHSAQHCLLRVPSAVTLGDFNLLINPAHADFQRIKIVETVPFPFDQRLLFK
jgi:RES domain-containing protein